MSKDYSFFKLAIYLSKCKFNCFGALIWAPLCASVIRKNTGKQGQICAKASRNNFHIDGEIKLRAFPSMWWKVNWIVNILPLLHALGLPLCGGKLRIEWKIGDLAYNAAFHISHILSATDFDLNNIPTDFPPTMWIEFSLWS